MHRESILTALSLSLILLLLCHYQVTKADTEEALSAITSRHTMDYQVVHRYPLTHRDGATVWLNLIKFNQDTCATVDGKKGCVAGFTEHVSDYKRKFDPEHPVDTTETINLSFLPGKKSKVNVREEEVLHELFHAVQYHYMSRSVCEANWRYSECQEAMAYDYTHLVNQVRKINNIVLYKN